MMDLFNEKMSQIKELDILKQKVTEDNTGEKFLGVKLDNGQFSALRGIDIFKVDQSFASIHPNYVSTKHLG